MAKLTGYALLEQVFGEEGAEDFHPGELEFMDGVTDIEQNSLGVDGWYETILHSFRYEGKLYSVEERSHVSDNVCDSKLLMDTFCEVEEPKTVFLLLTHQTETTVSPEDFDAQKLYQHMVEEKKTHVTMGEGEDALFQVHIKEYPGIIPTDFLEILTGKLLVDEEQTKELIQVQPI